MKGRSVAVIALVAAGGGGCSYDWSLEAQGPSAADRDASAGPVAVDASSAYRLAVLGDSPAFYWRLGETSGTSAFDEVARTTDATYEGAVTLGQAGALAGDPDHAVLLDGTTGCIAAGDRADFAGSAAFTFEAWIRPSPVVDGSYRRIVNKQSADGMQSYSVALTADSLLFQRYVAGDQKAVAVPAPAPAVYTYMAATYDGSTLRIYSDSTRGLVTQSIADDRPIGSIAAPLEIGCRPSVSTTFYEGQLDEVAIYGRALASGDLTRHYAIGVGQDAGD